MNTHQAMVSQPIPIKIEPLQTQHLEHIVELDQICFGGLWTKGAYERELKSPNSFLLGLVKSSLIPTEQHLIGIACFWAIVEEAHITLLGIHPNYRGQGWGKLLLCHLLEVAINWPLERATLEVRVSNHAAIALYRKLGFEIAGRRKDYYPAPPEDAFILWRSHIDNPDFYQGLKQHQQETVDSLLTKGWYFVPNH